MTKIVDTNVIAVANEKHEQVTDGCIENCALILNEIVQTGRLAIDDDRRIIEEYLPYTDISNGKKAGDVFLIWVLRNQYNQEKCDRVPIKENEERGFESFPEDPDLMDFDKSDRKFVAVANAHPQKPTILEAVDSKWLNWIDALHNNGINVELICEEDIKRFHRNKFGL
jgi:hypothetical protein